MRGGGLTGLRKFLFTHCISVTAMGNHKNNQKYTLFDMGAPEPHSDSR